VKEKEILNLSQLIYWLTLDTDTFFEQFKNHTREANSFTQRHVFVDMDAPILYVAHIDTVLDLFAPKEIQIEDTAIRATGMDDRLGCYLAFRLNLLGLKGDVLICDHEEIGYSTAKYFKTNKKYNWVCELDRPTVTVATYGLDSPAFLNALDKSEFCITKGTFSDISSLELPNNPCMFNLGIGYYQPHSFYSHLDKALMYRNVMKYAQFYEKNKLTSFVQA